MEWFLIWEILGFVKDYYSLRYKWMNGVGPESIKEMRMKYIHRSAQLSAEFKVYMVKQHLTVMCYRHCWL